MKTYLKEKAQFVILLSLWYITGVYGDLFVYPLVLLSLLLMRKKEMWGDMILGFFFILILSDNRHYYLFFAKDLKTYYVVILSAFYFFNRKEFDYVNNVYRPFIFFMIVAVLAMYDCVSYAVTIQKTASYILLFVIVPLYIIKAYKEHGEGFFRDIIYFTFMILLIGILIGHGFNNFTYYVDRYCGMLGNPNGLALYAFLSFLVVAVVNSYFPSLFTRIELIVIYAVVGYSVYLSGGRDALFSILIFLFFSRFYRMSPFIGFIIFFTITFSYELILDNLAPVAQALGLAKYLRVDTLSDASGRYVAWNFAWEEIQNSFYLGRGFAYDEYYFGLDENQNYLNWMGHQGGVHNTYLSLWMNTGIIGFVLHFLAFVYSFYKGATNSFMSYPIMYAILFSITYESWLMASLNPFTIQFLIIATLLTSSYFNEERKKENIIPVH